MPDEGEEETGGLLIPPSASHPPPPPSQASRASPSPSGHRRATLLAKRLLDDPSLADLLADTIRYAGDTPVGRWLTNRVRRPPNPICRPLPLPGRPAAANRPCQHRTRPVVGRWRLAVYLLLYSGSHYAVALGL